MCWFQPLTFLNFSNKSWKKWYEYWKRKGNMSRLKSNWMHDVISNCTVCSTACIPKIVTIWWRTPQSPICIKKFAKLIGLHQCLWASYQERSSKMMHFLLFFDFFLTSFTMRCDICYTTVPWKKLHLGTVRFLKQTCFYATFQCGRYNVFKEKFSFFAHKKLKNRPQKLLIIRPKLFFHVLAQMPKPAQNWFFIL